MSDPIDAFTASAAQENAQPEQMNDPLAAFTASAQAENPAPQTFLQKAGGMAKSVLGAIGRFANRASQIEQIPSQLLGKATGTGDYLLQKPVQAIQGIIDRESPGSQDNLEGGFGAVMPKEAQKAVVAGAGQMASDPLSYAGAVSKIPMLADALSHGAEAVPSVTASIGEKLTHVPAEALTEASTASGRAELQQAAQGIGKSGSDLADAVSSFSKNTPQKQIVDQALEKTPAINLQPAIDALQTAKDNIPTSSGIKMGADQAAMDKIQETIDNLKVNKSGSAQPGQAFKQNFDADEYRQIRGKLDDLVDWNQPWAKPVSEAVLQARTAMKNSLLAAAPPEYADAMKDWHDQIDLTDELKDFIGKSEGARQDVRAGSFLKQAAAEPDGGPRQALLAKFDAANGTDFLGQAKKAAMATGTGFKNGVPQLMPNISPMTGLSEAGAGAGFGAMAHHPVFGSLIGAGAVAGSSPAVAARAVALSKLPPAIAAFLVHSSPAISGASALPPQLQMIGQ